MRKCFLGLAAVILAFMPLTVFASPVYTNIGFKVKLNYSGLPVQSAVVSSYIPLTDFLSQDKTDDLLTIYLKPSAYKGTNLDAGAFILTVSKTIPSAKDCYNFTADIFVPHNNGIAMHLNKIRTVRGNAWHYTAPNPGNLGAGMNHSAKAELYRLYKNGACYEAVLGVADHTANVAENAHEKPWNQKKIFNYLGAVFNRLYVK